MPDPTPDSIKIAYIPFNVDHVRALIEGPLSFESKFGLLESPGWLEFPQILPGVLHLFETGKIDEDWPAFLIVDKNRSLLIGMGGYKSGPEGSQVEIGYGISIPYRNRGIITEFVNYLSSLAFGSGMVTSVIAHTLIEENASTRVLTKCGFRLVGEVGDPEEGAVWRWQKTVPSDQ